MNKISIRFFDDREVRAIWDEENNKWWFSVLDIVAVLSEYKTNSEYSVFKILRITDKFFRISFMFSLKFISLRLFITRSYELAGRA